MKELLRAVNSISDIPQQYLGTPVEILLRSHNLGEHFKAPESPQMLISLCMDHRKKLNIPDEFAYVLRNAGAFIGDAGFMISYAMTVGGIKTIAIIGHNHCGMTRVRQQSQEFVSGLEKHGWKHKDALLHYKKGVVKYAIPDEVDSVLKMAQSLESKYANLLVVPMIYILEDNLLYLINPLL